MSCKPKNINKIPSAPVAILLGAVLACSSEPTAPAGGSLQVAHMSQFDPGAGQVAYSDVWGYSDNATGQEYALIGSLSGELIYVVDATDPAAPAVASMIPVPSFDFKTRGQYLYTVTGGGDGGAKLGRIVDLSDPTAPAVVGAFPSSHNLTIDASGFMYLESPGLRIYDLNADPLNPSLVWQDNSVAGHDATVVGDRLYDFHGNSASIYDVSQRAMPQLLSSVAHPAINYYHSGWPTSDGRFLLVTDELSSGPAADITIWDIAQVDDPVLVSSIRDFQSTVHNVMIVGQFAFVSYYAAGFRVYDLSDPTQPALAFEYDTSPPSGEGWHGAFGVYPLAPSGNIYVSDMQNGLHIFSVSQGQ